MNALLVALVGLGWIGCGPILAWFMGRRGYDAFSWLAVGSILGPSALAMAMFERWAWKPPLPEVVVRGSDEGGSVNVLVVIDSAGDVVPVAGPLIQWFGGCVGRLSVARVLPEGAPGDERTRAVRAIKEVVQRFERHTVEGVLLFGSAEMAIGAKVRADRFHVVITATPNTAVTEALADTDVLHVDGGHYLSQLIAAAPT